MSLLSLLFSTNAAGPRGQVRPCDVEAYLEGAALAPEQERAVEIAVSQIQILTAEPRVRRRFEGMTGYMRRLPRIVYLTRRGSSPVQVAEDLGPMATANGVQVTLEILAATVAERVNRAA